MRNRISLIWLIAASIAVLCGAFSASGAVPRLRVSNNGRFLVKTDGSPFFWMGDTNWRLYKLTREDVDRYLDDRRARGFNVIQGPVLLHNNSGNESTNAYGRSNTDPAHPDAGWFDHIDYIFGAAEQRGMYIAPVVVWGDSMDALGSSQNERMDNASSFGQWLGNRYGNRSNIIWIVAGEYGIHDTGNDAKQVWNALGSALRASSGGSNGPLITIHPSFQDGWQSSSDMFQNAGWLSFNMIQSSQSGNWGAGAENWLLVTEDYYNAPVTPVIDGEAHYEGLAGWDAFGVRRRAYWSVFAGAFGHTYGSISVAVAYRGGGDNGEGASETWDDALNLPGASDMKFLRRLMESRPMLKRVPADNMLVTPLGGVPNRISATRDSQGRYSMIYVPEKNKSFIVNTNPIKGSGTRAWWYDCRNGKARAAGNFPHGGSRTFRTPNSGQDWVLILDNKDQGFGKPGIGGPFP